MSTFSGQLNLNSQRQVELNRHSTGAYRLQRIIVQDTVQHGLGAWGRGAHQIKFPTWLSSPETQVDCVASLVAWNGIVICHSFHLFVIPSHFQPLMS